MKIEEVSKVVWEINCDYWSDEVGQDVLEIHTNGDYILIKCGVSHIWHSEDDERSSIEDGDGEVIYEPMGPYLRGKIKQFGETLRRGVKNESNVDIYV